MSYKSKIENFNYEAALAKGKNRKARPKSNADDAETSQAQHATAAKPQRNPQKTNKPAITWNVR